MKLLIIKLSLFLFVCLGIITYILINFGGNVDYFYEKFTTPKAKSMIIGDSRSFQGIQPSIINKFFDKKDGFNMPILNYSFTGAQAISGPLYNKSILNKLDKTATNGIFIISLTPDFLTSPKDNNNILGEFREANQPPHNMTFVDMNPNYEYFIKNISFFHFKAMFRKNSKTHKDGWLEETNLPNDKETLEIWKKGQIDLFLKDRGNYVISKIRTNSLINLIEKLKVHGKVFLVRMPIGKAFLKYEEEYYPGFDKLIDSIAKTKQVSYYDFNKKNRIYNTYDGHHLDKFSGKEFTKNLCVLMQNSLKQIN